MFNMSSALALEEGKVHCAICDRSTLDGLAYWPGPADFFTARDKQGRRTAALFDGDSPAEPQVGYNHRNPRIESAEEAHAIDERIAQAWADHPKPGFIENAPDFMSKSACRALDAIVAALKESCQANCRSPRRRIVDGHVFARPKPLPQTKGSPKR